MRTLRNYRITALVALIAFLPVLWRTFPGMPMLAQVGLGLVLAALAGYVEHYKNVKPALELEAKRTFLFDYICQPKLAALREHDPTARLNVMEIDRRISNQFSVFRMMYGPSLQGDPDAGLSLRLRQGVCGPTASLMRNGPLHTARRANRAAKASQRAGERRTSDALASAGPWRTGCPGEGTV